MGDVGFVRDDGLNQSPAVLAERPSADELVGACGRDFVP